MLARALGDQEQQNVTLASSAEKRYDTRKYDAHNIGCWRDLGEACPVNITQVSNRPTIAAESP